MKRTRHTAAQIVRKLKTAEQLIAQGKTVTEDCRVLGVAQLTHHRWEQIDGGMQAEEARHPTQLDKENTSQEASGRSRAGTSHAQRPCREKLLSPERRRRAVVVLQERYRALERRVCRVVGQLPSTQRHPVKVIDLEEPKLRHRLREISADHIRWGRRLGAAPSGPASPPAVSLGLPVRRHW
jgi:putative transposase